jgi:carbon-monoxide dehydrogenase medium subunit
MWNTYINAESVDQVLSILEEKKSAARIIAGGTDLILEMERGARKGIDTLIDISRISGLDEIIEDEDGIIHLGPMVNHNDCVRSKLLQQKALPLVQAAWNVGSPLIRNRGTVTGNLVTASPANDTISPLMALDATLHLMKKVGTRKVQVKDFYTGVRKTILEPDEMVVDITFPALKDNEKGNYIKTALRKAQAISVVNVCVILTFKDKTITKAAITLGAVAPVIIHAEEAEEYLIGKELSADVIERSANLAGSAAKPIDDLRGSAKYRSYIVSVITRRALNEIQLEENGNNLLHNPPILEFPQAKNFDKKSYGTFTSKVPIETTINGQKYLLKNGQEKTLLRLIREDAGLIGTKEGCAEGECGSCTIHMDGAAVLSCLIPAPRAHGAVITTIEGMANGKNLHPVQQAFIEEGAVQCGYCTPGFIMSAAKLLEENSSPSEIEIKQALTGNLCRCTGYYKIVNAVDKAAKRMV